MRAQHPDGHNILGIFERSVCPDPNVFVFIAFTLVTVIWTFIQICLTYAPSPPRTAAKLIDKEYVFHDSALQSPAKRQELILTSFFYAITLGILLMDGCWLGTINAWAITRIVRSTSHGLADYTFKGVFFLGVLPCLLAGFVLWTWSLYSNVRRLHLSWLAIKAHQASVNTVGGP
ncbi:hypothetical protein E8E14_013548 [Neopestalotiopsis sp. 37M]|nr:hypothetical protein E8E14_013548 [Neopestalotiopsis sp. 37M]